MSNIPAAWSGLLRMPCQVTELTNEYAILKVREPLVETLAALPEIEYIEKPHRLYFQRENGKRVSCVNPVQRAPLSLTGKGVLVAVLDSVWIIPIRNFGMRTEPPGFWHTGTRQGVEHHRRDRCRQQGACRGISSGRGIYQGTDE